MRLRKYSARQPNPSFGTRGPEVQTHSPPTLKALKALGVDLNKIDFVIISHRHADHTSGLNYLLSVNSKVKIDVPDEPLGSVRPRST